MLVGRQHQVTQFRIHKSAADWAVADETLRHDQAWRDFLEAVKPLIASYDSTLMRPAPLAPMSPLFSNVPARAQGSIRFT
jgi:hypothetical protein